MKSLTKGVRFFTGTFVSKILVSLREHMPVYGYGVCDVEERWNGHC